MPYAFAHDVHIQFNELQDKDTENKDEEKVSDTDEQSPDESTEQSNIDDTDPALEETEQKQNNENDVNEELPKNPEEINNDDEVEEKKREANPQANPSTNDSSAEDRAENAETDKGTDDNVETNAEQAKDEEAAPYVSRTQYKFISIIVKLMLLDATVSNIAWRVFLKLVYDSWLECIMFMVYMLQIHITCLNSKNK